MKTITPKQLRFIYELAMKLNFSKSQLYRFCGGIEPQRLSKKEASEIIEQLLALYQAKRFKEKASV